ncbi:MAG: hemerythrin family protein [Bradyrhizobiaceae bacterium]|nr:hemerythrin family protein [Bradyrhizobiaceae bacterium]
MRLLQWKKEYGIGIEAVDHEHRQLIELINRMHEAFASDESKQTVSAFFGDILKEISAHFALEEKIMREEGYSRLGPHKEDHERLLDELREMMDAFDRSNEIDSFELALRLDTWFLRHFQTHDAQLHGELGEHHH